MALSLHRPRKADRAPATAHPAPAPAPAEAARAETEVPDRLTAAEPAAATTGRGGRVYTVQRIGAFVVAGVIAVFGVLGFANGLAFFSTDGEQILGLSSNGLLSTISVVTAVVLVFAAFRSPRTASTVMLVIGALFLVSALANLAVLNTDWNLLAFGLSNVGFSVVAGAVLLLLGAYGRVSGNLPADSPYARASADDDVSPVSPDEFPSTPAEFAAERAMRDAEVAVVQHVASFEQRRRVAAMSQVQTRKERREVWMSFDRARRDA
ncbi:protein of unknown function [Geodermatophilus dictyosporus]|uniref:DUF4383 domain-containing protein n=1 Tax=Geodermatophilus dictyosporus TaxID=1523247 RepID=A0A1I5N773_9ACTN|nr:DUF4383 domain-containing protein [Geodermatophilus dictyosporus]SFP17547.1 protein of unknown function [Geodermatophilus dictyosporus]